MGNVFKLKDGSRFIIAESPGGIYSSHQIIALAEISQKYKATLKVTEDQRLGVVISEDRNKDAITDLESSGLLCRNYRDSIHQPVCCIGSLCPFYKQDALNDAISLTEVLPDTAEGELNLRIGINGCEK